MVLTITLTGNPSVNGKAISNIKALELAYLFSENNGKISKKTILTKLYNNFCSKNALWYPVKGCTLMGVDVEYNAENREYVTNSDIASDLGKVLSSLEDGDIAKALFYLRGPILPGCQDWFADNMRTVLQQSLTELVEAMEPTQRKIIVKNLKNRGVAL